MLCSILATAAVLAVGLLAFLTYAMCAAAAEADRQSEEVMRKMWETPDNPEYIPPSERRKFKPHTLN